MTPFRPLPAEAVAADLALRPAATTADALAQAAAQGLYDPAQEHDACGVGFVAHIKGQKEIGRAHV